jgi:propionyl-CoA carboxylase alpha chain
LFSKILIANRGEIACRIIRTCRRMEIRTVAIYSEADSRALHVDLADEAYLIGLPPPRDSYLNSKKIIEAAIAYGAEAIHPGYGFLSENSDFAQAVEEAGLIFIGPGSDVIRLMGDKLQAKALARQAGVSILPGSETPVTTGEEVRAFAAQLGYPLLLKAAAGGGGKGMRVVFNDDQIDEHLERTTHEALSSFSDGRVFVEKYVETPRHVEIQILADTHGNIVHLGERDCSLQRRHQKVIEESPSPFITDETRQKMIDQAMALARQVGYTSAGTLEFMVTPNQEFYFLEMNTRLQVEHAITEMVTGLDLVEQMIRIAAGEPLNLSQSQISFSGHAIEARLYAEDGSHDFMPSSGRITRFEAPHLEETLRVDTGVEAGAEISIYYDPMIAKIIVWAPTRIDAIHHLRRALAEFIIEGPINNAGFLEQLLHQPNVIQGDYTTHFIEHEMKQSLSKNQKHLIRAIAAMIYQRSNPKDIAAQWVVVGEGEGVVVELKDDTVIVDKHKFDLDLQWRPQERRFVVQGPEETYYGQVHLTGMHVTVSLFGMDSFLQVMRPKMWDLYSHVHPPVSQPDNMIVKAPMPGILVSLPISVGDQVKLGQPLLVIEAMKMENVLKAPAKGSVMEIFVQPGDTLMRDQILVKLG